MFYGNNLYSDNMYELITYVIHIPTLTSLEDRKMVPPLPPPPGPDLSQHALVLLPWQRVELLISHSAGQLTQLHMELDIKHL